MEEACAGFVDDYGVGGYDIKCNIATLGSLFEAMSAVNYKLGSDKLELGYFEVIFLGHLLKAGTISPDPSKT